MNDSNKIRENHPVPTPGATGCFFNYRFDLPKTTQTSTSVFFQKEVQLIKLKPLQLVCDWPGLKMTEELVSSHCQRPLQMQCQANERRVTTYCQRGHGSNVETWDCDCDTKSLWQAQIIATGFGKRGLTSMPLCTGCLRGVEGGLGSTPLSVPGLITRHADEKQESP